MAARRGLPLTLAAFAVIGAASTAASADRQSTLDTAPAGRTILPPAVPPTYSYPGSLPGVPSLPGAPSNTAGSTAGPAGGTPSGEAAPALAANGIPARAVQAYQAAATSMASCGIPWSLLAAIGRVESNHGRFAGAALLADGRSDPPIVGIPLDGRPGVAQIGDTDSGRYDGDLTHDRAVGPMQFIPGTWALFATDGDRDGKSDPFDIDDAAAAAAKYLCQAGGDLSTAAGQQDAVYSYNRSDSYVSLVLALSAEYAGGAPVDDSPAPNGSPGPLPPIATPTLPPGTVGPPPAATVPPSASPKPKPKPTTASPTPGRPSPTTTAPSPTSSAPTPTTSPTTSPTPTVTPSSPTPTPSPTCTPAPTPTATPSGSASGNAASAASTPTASAASAETASPAGTTSASAAAAGTTSASAAATGTPTPTPSPTLPTCPTP
ncbi:MAG TPA: lytic murein transglycosylase [Mycobacteriales bacterium]